MTTVQTTGCMKIVVTTHCDGNFPTTTITATEPQNQASCDFTFGSKILGQWEYNDSSDLANH